MMRIFRDRQLPAHWVIGTIGGELWIVPAAPNGWAARTPYRLPCAYQKARLEEVDRISGYGLNIPGWEAGYAETA